MVAEFPVNVTPRPIRVMSAVALSLGLPLQGDLFYPTVLRGPDEAEDFSQPLQLLAQSISFVDPHTDQVRTFSSRLALSITS